MVVDTNVLVSALLSATSLPAHLIELILEVEHASVAETPGVIGSARENPARKQLEKLLPAFVAAGIGIVIDYPNAEAFRLLTPRNVTLV